MLNIQLVKSNWFHLDNASPEIRQSSNLNIFGLECCKNEFLLVYEQI